MSYQLRRELLVETFSFDPTRLEEGGTYVEKLGNGRYRFRAKAQHCGVKNRNNRVYPIPVWEQHTSPACAFIKRVRARRVIGHLEHPTDGKSQMGLAAVLVVEVEAPNDKGEVWAIFETLSTPAGRIVESFIRDGVGFGISSRGNGSVVNKGGIDEVQDDYEPITFDMVIDESTPGAEVHARRLKESLCALMESAGGDTARAIRIDQQLAEEALARDLLAEQAPPTGFSRFCLAYEDGSAHYRAYDNGVGGWDVWLHPHNLPPEEIVSGLSTVEAAQEAAKQHYRMVMLSGQRDAEGEAADALEQEWATMREAYSVRSAVPYSGIALRLGFTSAAEAKAAYATVLKAGFHADLEEESVTVYTSIEDEDAATAHLARLLTSKGIDVQTESAGFIHRGRAVWEDEMTLRRLNEMPYGGMEEMPYGDEDEFDSPMFDAEDGEDDEEPEDDEEDDAEDDEEPEDEGCYGEFAFEQDDEEPEDGEGDGGDGEDGGDEEPTDEQDDEYADYEDDPENIDLNVDDEEYDMDGNMGEGHVKVWFDADDDPVEFHYFDEDGFLEAVTDADGNVLLETEALNEMPTAGMRAAFAKAFARDDAKAGKVPASKAREQSPEYYRKFRKKYATGGKSKTGKKFKGYGVDPGSAYSGYGRFKRGKNVRGGPLKARIAKGARMTKRPIKHHAGKAPVAGKKKGRKKLAASVERIFNQDTNLVETYMGSTLIEMRDPDTGLVLFELAGGKGSPASAMFAKMFSKKEPAVSIRKRQKNYSKLRAGYASTTAGKGMSAAKLKKGDRSLPSKEKKARGAERKKMAPFRAAARKLRKGAQKMQAAAAQTKRGGKHFTKGGALKIRKLRKEAFDLDLLRNLLIEDETGAIYTPEMEIVGGITEHGDFFVYDEDGNALAFDPSWLDEDEEYEYEEYDDDYDLEEMEVGAHGGGQPVALKMKGTGQEGRNPGLGPWGTHAGGDASAIKRKQGSPGTMRGGGTTEEGYDPYVARLEDQIARQQEIIDAYQDLQHAEAMEEAKRSILDSHPELSVVESRLDRCQSAEEMRVEAEALLTLVESSRGTQPWNGRVEGGGVNSGSVGGAPDATLLAEEQVITGFDAALAGAASSDTASRVAAARRRRLDEAQN